MSAPARPTTPPPWCWSNLSDDDARALDAAVAEWVMDYNRHLALRVEEIVPACWRQHRALVQELPVQYHAWRYVHRDPASGALPAADIYYGRVLPGFRDRVELLLSGPHPSRMCRNGKHPPSVPGLDDVVARAATDLDAHGPDIIDELRATTFG